MTWGPHGLKLLGSGGGNFGDSNSKSTFQKVKNNTWKIRKCPVFYVDRRAKCRKRSPQKWFSPSLESWLLCPPPPLFWARENSVLWGPLSIMDLMAHHSSPPSYLHHTSWNVSFLKFYYFVDWEIFYYKLFHLRFKTSFPALQLYSLTAQPQATSNFSIEKEGCISTAILPKWYC